MTPVLIACGISGFMMFCLFFVLPNLDRLKGVSTTKKARAHVANHDRRTSDQKVRA